MKNLPHSSLKDIEALYRAKNFKKAYKLLNKIKTDNAYTLELKTLCSFALKDIKFCIRHALALIEISDTDNRRALGHHLLGACYDQQGKAIKAINELEKSIKFNDKSTNGLAYNRLLHLYFKNFFLNKFEMLAPKLLHWEPYFSSTMILLIKSAARSGNKALLTERLYKIKPYVLNLTVEQYADVVHYFIRLGLFQEATSIIDKYEQTYKNVQDNIQLRASIAFAKEKYHQVISMLPQNVIEQYPAYNYVKAKAYERIGIYEKAYSCFEKGASYRKGVQSEVVPIDFCAEYSKIVDNLDIDKKEKGSKNDNFTHIFIFGFPRSGTTLLDNILDTQTGVAVMSERPAIPMTIDAFQKVLGKSYPSDLEKLDEKEVKVLRDIYFSSINELGIDVTDAKFLVDKHPYHTVHLPLLVKLFPQAKYLLSLRHPLDVVLSCFQTDFELNNENFFLVTMKDIVTRYISVFSLFERYQAKYNVDINVVKYEHLIESFDESIDEIFKFIGLVPDKSYKVFHEHAKSKYVNTASRGQTSKPLYSSSINKWMNYQSQLFESKEKLIYFINKYGY